MVTMRVEAREAAILARLKDRYEFEGYDVFVHPPKGLVPPFVEPFRPDAIALKGDGGLIIEVKVGRQRSPNGELAALAQRIQDHKDWKLLVFYDDDLPAEAPIHPPSITRIETELEEVEGLAAAGQSRAAFLVGWGAFEAVARALIERDGATLSRPPSALTLAEYLERNGLLDEAESRTLRLLVTARNAAVHGDLSHSIEPNEVDALLDIGRRLLDQLKQPAEA